MTKKTGKQAAEKQESVLELVLSNFAYHCAVIMSTEQSPAGRAFSLHLGGYEGMPAVSAKIEIRAAGGDPKNNPLGIWDQCTVNGQWEGNRCGARQAYAKLCAPVIAAAARIDAERGILHRAPVTVDAPAPA